MKLWKKVLIILLIVIAIFVILTLRKMLILISLDNKVSELENTKDNIYVKVISERDDIYKSNVSEVYIKDNTNKSTNTIERLDGGKIELVQITYPNERKLFMNNGTIKTLNVYQEKAPIRGTDIKLNEENQTSYSVLVNLANTDNLVARIVTSIMTKINEVELDGRECYKLSGKYGTTFMYEPNTKMVYAYIEKETGLLVKLVELMNDGKEYITTYEYKFDIVTDENLKEPDASEYILQE